jgi:protoporphyrinogen oxidase
MGQLYTLLADEVTRLGGVVRTGVRVVGLEAREGRVAAVRADTPRGPESIPVGELLATMPLPEVAAMLRPDLPPAATEALRFRALTFVNLMLARRDFSENTWMYVASGDARISRIQEPRRRSPWMAPEGRTSLMLEVPCDVADEVWSASTSELRELVVAELAELGFRIDDVIGAFVVRVAGGYPVYDLGYDHVRRRLLREVAQFENVRVAGRQGLFRYIFMDAAMRMGIAAAEQMLAGRRDAEAIDAIGRSKRVVETTALTA